MTEINVVDIFAIIGWIYGLVSVVHCMIIKKLFKSDIEILTEKNKVLSKEYAYCQTTLCDAIEEIKKCDKKWWE